MNCLGFFNLGGHKDLLFYKFEIDGLLHIDTLSKVCMLYELRILGDCLILGHVNYREVIVNKVGLMSWKSCSSQRGISLLHHEINLIEA